MPRKQGEDKAYDKYVQEAIANNEQVLSKGEWYKRERDAIAAEDAIAEQSRREPAAKSDLKVPVSAEERDNAEANRRYTEEHNKKWKRKKTLADLLIQARDAVRGGGSQ